MASPSFRFFKDGILRTWEFGNLLRRNDSYDVIDSEGEIFVPKVPISTANLDLTGKIWFKSVSSNTVIEVMYGDQLMFKFDNVNGNLLFGFNDINVLPLEKGGTNYEASGPDDAAKLADLLDNHFGLKEAAFLESGTTAGTLLKFTEDAKLPALDGSLLTGIANIPVGMVDWFATETAPSGYLKCNGAQISRTTYEQLWLKIGDRFGAGNGTTTFTLPDLRGVFIRGWDDGRGIDAARAFASYQDDELKSHTHNINASGGSSGPQNAISIDSNNAVRSGQVYATGGVETRPKNVALLPCIKY